MTDFNLRAARIQLGALLVALVVAILIALGITTGAFVLSFAVQRDLARQALIPEHLTWIFPAIVDSAIFGATIAIVILSKLKMSMRDKGFFIALATGVVAISVLGNAYHAFHAAVAAQEFVASGGELDFTPLAPAMASAIAIIPPALTLAFTEAITILIKAIGIAYAQYTELARGVAAVTDVASTEADVAPAESGIAADNDVASAVAIASHQDAIAEPRHGFTNVITSSKMRTVLAVVGAIALPSTLALQGPFETIILAAALTAAWWFLRRSASARAADAPAETTTDVAPDAIALGIAAPHDVASVDRDPAPVVATPIETEPAATEFVVERQTVAQLLAFIDRSDLDPMVKKTATLKINNPSLTFHELAEATNVRAASTAMRRYNRAEDAAIAAGFTIPPLPTFDYLPSDSAFGNDRNDRNEDIENTTQLVHS